MPNLRTGLIAYDDSLRLVYCNAAAQDLAGEAVPPGAHGPMVGLADALRPDPSLQDAFPSSQCRVLASPHGPVPYLLNYRKRDGYVIARFEPLAWMVAFANLLRDFVVVTTQNDAVVYANGALRRAAGIPSEQWLDLPIANLAAFGGVPSTVVGEMSRAALGGVSLSHEFAISLPPGIEMRLTASSVPLRYYGQICGVLWTAHELVPAETRDAQALSAAGERLVALYQHELRNPMQTVEAALAIARLRDDGRCAELYDLIDREIRTMNDVLSEPPYPSEAAHKTLCRLSDVVTREIKRARLRWGTHLLTFSHDATDTDALLCCDVTAMGRVFANLFDNVAHVRSTATVSVSYAWDDQTVTCCVRDDGPGFPDALLGHELLSDGYPTKHLGIALVRATVQGCSGTLTLSNPPQGGALVRMTFPRVRHASTRPTAV